MEIKIGSVACMREELAGKITGMPENNKFLITALTDHSVTIRSLADNKTHSLRVDSFANNIKWWETLKQPDAGFKSNVVVKSDTNIGSTENQQSPQPATKPVQPDKETQEDKGLSISYSARSKGIRMRRVSASSNFVPATSVYDDPFGSDPFGGIYG